MRTRVRLVCHREFPLAPDSNSPRYRDRILVLPLVFTQYNTGELIECASKLCMSGLLQSDARLVLCHRCWYRSSPPLILTNGDFVRRSSCRTLVGFAWSLGPTHMQPRSPAPIQTDGDDGESSAGRGGASGQRGKCRGSVCPFQGPLRISCEEVAVARANTMRTTYTRVRYRAGPSHVH